MGASPGAPPNTAPRRPPLVAQPARTLLRRLALGGLPAERPIAASATTRLTRDVALLGPRSRCRLPAGEGFPDRDPCAEAAGCRHAAGRRGAGSTGRVYAPRGCRPGRCGQGDSTRPAVSSPRRWRRLAPLAGGRKKGMTAGRRGNNRPWLVAVKPKLAPRRGAPKSGAPLGALVLETFPLSWSWSGPLAPIRGTSYRTDLFQYGKFSPRIDATPAPSPCGPPTSPSSHGDLATMQTAVPPAALDDPSARPPACAPFYKHLRPRRSLKHADDPPRC